MVGLSVSSSLPVFTCLLLFTVFVHIESVPVSAEVATEQYGGGVASGFKVLYKLYDDCSNRYTSVSNCLKDKTITLLDRVNSARSDVLSFGDGVLEIVRTGEDYHGGRSVDNSVDNVGEDAEEVKLNAVLYDRITRFFNTHTLKFNFPKFSSWELQRSIEEGMWCRNIITTR